MGAPRGNRNAAGAHKGKKGKKSKKGSYLKHHNSIRGRAEMRAREKDSLLK